MENDGSDEWNGKRITRKILGYFRFSNYLASHFNNPEWTKQNGSVFGLIHET